MTLVRTQLAAGMRPTRTLTLLSGEGRSPTRSVGRPLSALSKPCFEVWAAAVNVTERLHAVTQVQKRIPRCTLTQESEKY